MKKALAVSATDLGTPVVLWSLLLGELAVGVLMAVSSKLPSVLVGSLQLFLRF